MYFDNILGQEYVSGIFRNILRREQLAHNYIFAGPEGVGKLLFAQRLAQILLCEHKNACDECRPCQQVKHRSHPDLRIIGVASGEKYISIDAVREMEHSLHLKPYQGAYKIFILNEADLMAEEAASALLKTLEEPPTYALIILVTAKPESLLPTVLSRGQLVRFRPLSDEALIALMEKESSAAPEQNRLLAYLADGRLGWLRTLKETQLLQQREQLVKSLLAGTRPEGRCEAGASAERAYQGETGWGESILNLARDKSKSLQQTRQNIVQIFKIISLCLRDALIMQLDETNDSWLINKDHAALVRQLQNRYPVHQLINMLTRLQEAEKQIRLNGNINLVLTALALNMGRDG